LREEDALGRGLGPSPLDMALTPPPAAGARGPGGRGGRAASAEPAVGRAASAAGTVPPAALSPRALRRAATAAPPGSLGGPRQQPIRPLAPSPLSHAPAAVLPLGSPSRSPSPGQGRYAVLAALSPRRLGAARSPKRAGGQLQKPQAAAAGAVAVSSPAADGAVAAAAAAAAAAGRTGDLIEPPAAPGGLPPRRPSLRMARMSRCRCGLGRSRSRSRGRALRRPTESQPRLLW
jgi:hypothetical protein